MRPPAGPLPRPSRAQCPPRTPCANDEHRHPEAPRARRPRQSDPRGSEHAGVGDTTPSPLRPPLTGHRSIRPAPDRVKGADGVASRWTTSTLDPATPPTSYAPPSDQRLPLPVSPRCPRRTANSRNQPVPLALGTRPELRQRRQRGQPQSRHRPPKAGVAGSNPAGGTMQNRSSELPAAP